MKHTEVLVTTTTEEIVTCDVCQSRIYEAPQPLYRAGTFSASGYMCHYGINLAISHLSGSPVEHICRNCLAAALKDIAEKI